MIRKIIFKDNKTEIAMPVAPAEYSVSNGMRIESINLYGVGDINLAGRPLPDNIKLTVMFPSKKYPFLNSGARTNPDYYINYFKKWVKNKTVVRYIVSGTKVNKPVLIEDFTYGEKDGTNDVYADITLREYKELKKVSVSVKKNKSRPKATTSQATRKHKVIRGDTLWAISRKYYGDATLCWKLAKYNKIKNANLIYVGQTITIPEVTKL